MAEKVEKKGLYDNRERIRLNKEINRLNGIIEDKDEMIMGINTQLTQEEAKVKKWETRQAEGYTAVKIKDGYVMEAVTVPPNCKFIFSQSIPKEIGTAKYQNFPFVKTDLNGKMIFDSQKYKRYRSI